MKAFLHLSLRSSLTPKLCLTRTQLRENRAQKTPKQNRRKEFQTHHNAVDEFATFLLESECGCFLFELLQDGVLPPLKCPLCPEGVSLSAAKSDRQSGALKAHTPFSTQRLRRQTPGLRSHTHRLSVFRVTGVNDPPHRTINTTKRRHLRLRPAGVACVKVLCVKSPFTSF